MRHLVILMLMLALSGPAFAEDKGNGAGLTDAEKARIKSQSESLKNAKLKEAEAANKAVDQDLARQHKAIDARLKKEHEHAETLGKNMMWMYGHDAMHHATQVRKQQLTEEAQAEKQAAAKVAEKKAAAQRAAAQKAAEGINQSVEGLKSQVSKEGQFGLQPKGSNLHVRHYGTK